MTGEKVKRYDAWDAEPSDRGIWVYYDDHLAAIRAAVEEERRQCINDACGCCMRGGTPERKGKNFWHPYGTSGGHIHCGANAIRARGEG